jgi:hypothetical protein
MVTRRSSFSAVAALVRVVAMAIPEYGCSTGKLEGDEFGLSSFVSMGSDKPGRFVFFRSRIALAVGFGGLLSIMALAGIDALRVLGSFRRSDQEIRSRYLAENHVLNDIRSDVYVSGTYVRDYLLEPEPPRAEV